VHLFDGRTKANQTAHFAVVDLTIGRRDLQQCADAVIRLRAEYLRDTGSHDEICFHFTSGDLACWARWRAGWRPCVSGNLVQWEQSTAPDSSDACFWGYLESVFTYAGSYSLARELVPVPDWSDLTAGDVLVQGGFPGHAALVVDVASTEIGDKVFLLAQSYMPAQEIHVLVNPRSPTSPWYRLSDCREGQLVTPEWTFEQDELRRFP
jgi:hypothetical protein